ncbi:ABC transporter ATP-binding protein [Lunatibacter salilacus]|uniref:ABC transporter ATP-binding protein n=1 Tax=Lunatibacter salilacus TaxID=2483804 RepID=UPI00131B0AE3|nr:ABC transporter ATP-binding protein [Lunatibacter salilacus]
MSEIVIKTAGLYKIYNENTIPVYALRDVSVEIEKGAFVAVVGPSGSGKTTLLNIVGGLDQPTRGSVTVDDRELAGMSENELINFRRDHIGFVFQAFNLIPVLTARENAEFVMLLQGIPDPERTERVDSLLEAVGIADKAENKPSELSGGQQQRVAVARALAPKPAFILADEPTANLDTKSAYNLLDMMEKLNKEEHITFVFSTHDPRVMERARRIITLEDGAVVSDVVK